MDNDVAELLNLEVVLYVRYCQAAAEHDQHESLYKGIAHELFTDIQEIRQTGKSHIPPILK